MNSTQKRLALVVLALSTWAGVQAAQGTDQKSATPADPANVKKADVHGDPLPEGALARMGTLRWRHGAAVTFVGYTAKGKQVVTGCADGIFRVWDATTGKEIRRFGNAPDQGQVQLPGGGVMLVGRNLGSVAVMSLDGGRLAAQAADGTVQVWDVASGKEIPTAPKEAKPMAKTYGTTAMAFSRDGKNLAVRGADQTLRVLDLQGNQEPRTVGQEPKPNQAIRYGGYGASLVFLAEGKALASLSMEVENQMPANLLRTFDLESGKEIRQLKAKENNFALSSLAVSEDGKVLAWAQQSGILLLDANTGKEIRTLALKQNAFINTMVFSPNGKILAIRSANNPVIQLWDVDGAKELGQLGEVAAPNFRGAWMGGGVGGASIAFAPDSATLIEGTAHNTVRFWNVADKKEIQSAGAGHHGGVTDLALSADGKVLITHGADRTIRQWDMTTGEPKAHLRLPADAATVVLATNGKLAASASANNTVKLWDIAEGKESRVAIAGGGPHQAFIGYGTSLALSPDSKLLAVRGGDQTIRLFETDSGKELPALNEPAKVDPNGARFLNYYGNAVPLTFLPNGTGLASVTSPMAVMAVGGPTVGGAGNSILVWNLPDKRPRRIESPTQPIRALAFSRDGRTIATIKADNKVSLLESLTGQEYFQIELKTGKPAVQLANLLRSSISVPTVAPSLALSPDGRTLAIGEKDIRLWDLRSGKELGKFAGHQAQVSSLLFAADNRTLISGSADTTALVWDAGRFIKDVASAPMDWNAQQMEDLWKDLAADAAKGIKTMYALEEQPKLAVAIFKERLKPAAGVDAKRIEQLVADLASEQYPVRKKATDELEKLGELAQPALEKAQTKEPTLETQRRIEKLLEKILNDQAPTAQMQQALRAMQVLQEIGSPDARQLLQTVAQGAPGHRLTRHAEQALKRLGK